MSNIINFAKAKSDAEKLRSEYFATLHVFVNSDSGEVWAEVESGQKIDPDWNTLMAYHLRQLAWLSDVIAADGADVNCGPVASINLFEDSRISTRWNGDIVTGMHHVEWIRGQLECGVSEIVDAISQADQERR